MVRAYLAGQDFRRARTPEAPHEYLLLTRSTDPWAHLCVIAWLAVNGTPGRWTVPGGKGRALTYRYFDAGDGWEYWASPPAAFAPAWKPPAAAPTILNRRKAQ
jgi:hypothetical protein